MLLLLCYMYISYAVGAAIVLLHLNCNSIMLLLLSYVYIIITAAAIVLGVVKDYNPPPPLAFSLFPLYSPY